jgi:hypothetical protein
LQHQDLETQNKACTKFSVFAKPHHAFTEQSREHLVWLTNSRRLPQNVCIECTILTNLCHKSRWIHVDWTLRSSGDPQKRKRTNSRQLGCGYVWYAGAMKARSSLEKAQTLRAHHLSWMPGSSEDECWHLSFEKNWQKRLFAPVAEPKGVHPTAFASCTRDISHTCQYHNSFPHYPPGSTHRHRRRRGGHSVNDGHTTVGLFA